MSWSVVNQALHVSHTLPIFALNLFTLCVLSFLHLRVFSFGVLSNRRNGGLMMILDKDYVRAVYILRGAVRVRKVFHGMADE